ncbi:zinc finger protein 830 [Chanos chanos]|uniref:Zinc finger protein 830 n=1 Tax=Chanos chanos TaxID=29144 RepID=A0A6J2VJL9_CHACN|nr:zinc finger protein 830 [Chanos chanos]
MMATARANKGKKVVNQDELRRLMRQQQRQSTERQKRVESPFAKYNSLGHLSCVLCNVQVKSEILWQAHVLGKQHKDKVAELKAKQSGVKVYQTPQSATLKRKTSDSEPSDLKKAKAETEVSGASSGLPADFFEGKSNASTAGSTHSAGLGLLAGVYNDDDDDNDDDEVKTETNGKTGSEGKSDDRQKGTPTPGLPADFFDSSIPTFPSVTHSGSISKADEDEKISEKKENTAEALPEGFFDDPVKDARVRNVDTPKDQMDKEWEEFQKEMRQVNSASDAIVAEDDEEGRLERQIDEIDEQIECYRRVELLREKQDVVKRKAPTGKMETNGEPSDSDEEDEEELLNVLSRDWRAKGALA